MAEPDNLNQGVKHGIVISLCRSMTFAPYTLYHEGSQGNTEDVTTRMFDPVTTQFLWLEVLNPSGKGDGTVRLYELEVYDWR